MKLDFRAKLIAALAVLALVTGAECGDGKDFKDPKPKPDPTFTLTTYVEDEFSPYVVTIHIAGGAGRYPTDPIPVASGYWSHEISYRPGANLTVSLGIDKAKPGSKQGYCKIKDGNHVTQKYLTGLSAQTCQTNTKR